MKTYALIKEDGREKDELTSVEIGENQHYEVGDFIYGETTDENGNDIDVEGVIVEIL